MGDSYPKYVTREAMESLVEKLNLPGLDAYSQDWECEVSDSSRIAELISFYESNDLSKEEKFALMIIMIASLNDALEEGCVQPNVWNKIRYHLLNEIDIHRNTIIYWALDDENIEDCFAITPLMRDILKDFKKNMI